MRLGEAPSWRVVRYDSVTKRGLVRGPVGELPFDGAATQVDDFCPDEPVFVSLASLTQVRRLWPATAHLAVSEPVNSPGISTRSIAIPTLPYPLIGEFEQVPSGFSLVACEPYHDEGGPLDVTVGIDGELLLHGARLLEGAQPWSGHFSLRPASLLEQAWLQRRHQLAVDQSFLVLSEAGSGSPMRLARAPVAFAVTSLEWRRHAAAQTQALDAALRPGLASLSAHPDGTVTAGSEVLGRTDADHARRWVLACNRLVLG